jgi:hypothetical protein
MTFLLRVRHAASRRELLRGSCEAGTARRLQVLLGRPLRCRSFCNRNKFRSLAVDKVKRSQAKLPATSTHLIFGSRSWRGGERGLRDPKSRSGNCAFHKANQCFLMSVREKLGRLSPFTVIASNADWMIGIGIGTRESRSLPFSSFLHSAMNGNQVGQRLSQRLRRAYGGMCHLRDMEGQSRATCL